MHASLVDGSGPFAVALRAALRRLPRLTHLNLPYGFPAHLAVPVALALRSPAQVLTHPDSLTEQWRIEDVDHLLAATNGSSLYPYDPAEHDE
jgi:hypothetical protein